MKDINRIKTCPCCGADVSAIDPANINENKCPYCGFELYNHSEEIYEEKIETLKDAKKKLISTQLAIAIVALVIVGCTVLFVIGRTIYRSSNQYFEDQSDDMTKKLHKAYKSKAWDKLYDLVIENADKALASPYYFSYRAAWLMSVYTPIFDEAVSNNDADGMTDAYNKIKDEYEYREELAEVYEFVPQIEADLEAEYIREKNIMEAHNLLE